MPVQLHSSTRERLAALASRRLPVVLLFLLLIMHILLSAFDHHRRGHVPFLIYHSAHMYVLNEIRYLDGYLPVSHPGPDTPGLTGGVYIDGTRGPVPDWSDPRAVYKELTEGRLKALWNSQEYMSKLPLPFFLTAVVHNISGGSIMAVSLTPQLFVALLLLSVYFLGRRAGGPWIGLAAAVIASGYPGVYQLARTHHDSLALTALTTAVIRLLAHSRGFTRPWVCALAGVVLYLSTLAWESVSGTMLVALFLAGPFTMQYLRLLGRCRSSRADALRGMLGLALFLSPMCLFFDWMRFFDFVLYARKSWVEVSAYPTVGNHVPQLLHGVVSYLCYLFDLAFSILQPLMAIWLVAGAAMLWRAPRGERLTVALSVAIPLVLLSVMPKKASWYILPVSPALALITALGLRGIRTARVRRVAITLAAGSGLLMPLFSTLVPPTYRDLVDLDRISPAIKMTVASARLPLRDRQDDEPRHLTDRIPMASAAQELVAHDLRNNPKRSGPRRVAVFGEWSYPIEALRYVVELSHPEMFVLDFLYPAMVMEARQRMLEKIAPDQFDYLVFVGNDNTTRLEPFPSEGWDPLESRMEMAQFVPSSVKPMDRADMNSFAFMDARTKVARKQWSVRFRRFARALLARKWKRIDLSVGPVYQAVD